MSKLIVIGSLNMDIVSRIQHFAKAGETIHSSHLAYYPGGKGANQAVAAARFGAECVMVGAVGSDGFADQLIDQLQLSGVNTEHVLRTEGASGTAYIMVNESGENIIVVSEGSNGKLSPQAVDEHTPWEKASAILLQNEIPWETTCHIIAKANQANVPVWFNPAPARSIPAELWEDIDTFIMNETETALITGKPVYNMESAKAAAELLTRQGAKQVIVTLGEQGCIYTNAEGMYVSVAAYEVKAVDTTAAGDTFIGVYAAATLNGATIEAALSNAVAASALAVTKDGAQASIPQKQQVAEFIAANGMPLISR
ncbi:ribokinase [Paenibacillus sp. FSL W7-1287]|uniref:ribokinase n=1 Tax=Paenibacillus sp. FSL W7-1287 TaxID=2954538 RepID=UPI0030F77505